MADRAHEQASGRVAARALLDAALSGVRLTPAERRFLGRLSQWDKRTSSTVASLITRARQTGREEAAVSAPALDARSRPQAGHAQDA